MRLLCAIFAVVFLLAEIAPNAAFVNPDASDADFPNLHTPTALEAAASKRLLRVAGEAFDDEARSDDTGGEERAAPSSVDAFVAKLMQMANTSPKTVFNRLGLANAKVDLNKNAVFNKWLQYVNKFRMTKGADKFPDYEILALLRKKRLDKDLVPLFQSLRDVHGMKNLADKLQFYVFQSSPSSRSVMNNVWLKAKVTPDEVFNIIRLQDDVFKDSQKLLQWLKYTQQYRNQVGSDSITDLAILNHLMKAPHTKETDFGALFVSLEKEADMLPLAKRLQAKLFQKWRVTNELTPDELGRVITRPTTENWEKIFGLPVTDARYQLLKAYTVTYAASRGKTVKKGVIKLFSKNQPVAALIAAMSV